MSYWSNVKSAANPLDPKAVVQPNAIPPKPQAVPQVPAIQPVAQPPVLEPVDAVIPQSQNPSIVPPVGDLGGNEINLTPRAKDGVTDSQAVQDKILPVFVEVMHSFPQQNPDIYKAFKAQVPKFDQGLANFFLTTAGSHQMAWYNWFIQQAKGTKITEALNIKRLLSTDEGAAYIGTKVKEYVAQNPQAFAEAVAAFAPHSDRIRGGTGKSTNDAVGSDGKGQLGDNFSGDNAAGRLNQRQDELTGLERENDVPDTSDVAAFWSKQRKSEIIAPDVTPAELKEVQALAASMMDADRHAKLHEVLGNIEDHRNKQGVDVYHNLRSPEEVKMKAVAWPFLGISDSYKHGSTALANWQEYLASKGHDSQQIVQATQTGGPTLDGYMGEMIDDMDDQNSPIWGFINQKARDYVETAYDIQQTEEMVADTSQFRPRPGDMQSFGRLAKVAGAAAFREYRYHKVNQFGKNITQDKAGTALRRWGYVTTKIPAIIDKLHLASTAPAGQFIPFGQDGFDEESGKKKFIHRGKDGTFYIREVKFDPKHPILDEKSLNSYIATNGTDTPLTNFNWQTVANMIDPGSYIPQMVKKVMDIDPASMLKTQRSTKDGQPVQPSPLSQQLDTANEQFLQQNQNPQDRLQGYRQARGQHIAKVMQEKGITSEEVLQAIKGLNGRKGVRASDPKVNQQWLAAIVNGKPIEYSDSDFETLSMAISQAAKAKGQPPVAPTDVYAPYSKEYDGYNRNDHSQIAANLETATASFGRYIVHRKRVQAARGFAGTNWSNKSLFCFLSMCNMHRHFSNPRGTSGQYKDKPMPESTGVGSHLYDATGNEYPLHETRLGPDKFPLKNEQFPKGMPITNQEEANRDLIDHIRDVPREDLYKGQSGLRPTGWDSEQFQNGPDGEPILDEDGQHKVKYVEPKHKSVHEQILNSFRTLHPESLGKSFEEIIQEKTPEEKAALEQTYQTDEQKSDFEKSHYKSHPEDGPWGNVKVMQMMKEEKKQEIQKNVSRSKANMDRINAILSGPPEALVPNAIQEFGKHDPHVTSLTKKLRQQGDTSIETNAERDSLRRRRWNQQVAKSGKTPEEYAKSYMEYLAKATQSDMTSLHGRLQQLEQANPDDGQFKAPKRTPGGKRMPGTEEGNDADNSHLRRQLDLFTPTKYKRRMYAPEGEPGNAMHRTFQPLDWLKQDDFASNANLYLVVKTAAALDRLESVRERLTCLAMPTEFVDKMMESVSDDYETQFMLIARRFNGGRDTNTTASADKTRRRLWSLLLA